MPNYYFLCAKEYHEMAIAVAPKGTKLSYELFPQIIGLKELPFEFTLIKMSDSKSGIVESEDLTGLKDIWMDYQASHPIFPLMSERLKVLIDKRLTGEEGLDWMLAKINGNGEKRIYYIPVFQKVLDVLDMAKQKFIGKTLLNPPYYFSYEKVKNMSVFHLPGKPEHTRISSDLYISERLKKAIQREKLLGIGFEKTVLEQK